MLKIMEQFSVLTSSVISLLRNSRRNILDLKELKLTLLKEDTVSNPVTHLHPLIGGKKEQLLLLRIKVIVVLAGLLEQLLQLKVNTLELETNLHHSLKKNWLIVTK